MDGGDATRLVSSSIDADIPAPSTIFTTMEEKMSTISDIFSSSMHATQKISSSSSTSSLPTSLILPSSPRDSSPVTSDRETEEMDQMIENLDFSFAASKEACVQDASCLLSTFEHDFDCDGQFAQEGYNIDDLLQQRPEDLSRPHFLSPSSVLPSSGCDDYAQISDAWCSYVPAACLPSECSTSKLEDSTENLSEVFAKFLNTNRDCFSIEDLKKIKLKTSTIESATQRLGGGRKGMFCLLKLILMWVQDHHLPQKRHKSTIDPFSASLDDRLLDRILSSPYSVEDDFQKADVSFRESLGNVCNSERGYQSFSSSYDNTVSGQDTREGGNVVRNMKTSYDGHVSSQASAVEAFGRPYFSTDPRLNLGRPTIYIPTADANSQLQHNHLYKVSHLSPYDRLWHTSSAQVNPREAAFRDQNHRSFGCSSPVYTEKPLNAPTITPAATTRAARKSRMARQRWSVRRAHCLHNFSSATSQLPWSSQTSGALFRNKPFTLQLRNEPLNGHVKQSQRQEKSLKFLLQKELKQSDVGNLGRIVLPKKEAELNLPYLAVRDGITVVTEDWDSSKIWNMRYRFWPNNKSRMYLLENTGEFVKFHHLKEGDHMVLYHDTSTGKYIIRGVKVPRRDALSASTCKSSSSSSGSGVTEMAAPGRTVDQGTMLKALSDTVEADSSLNGSSVSPLSLQDSLPSTDGSLRK